MTAATLISTAASGTPEWHAARASGIGGSEVAAIIGASPWQSAYSLWHAKRNGWITDAGPEAEWGKYLEPALLAWYRDHHIDLSACEWLTASPGTYAKGWRHANPDGLVVGALLERLRIVECKKASSDDDWGTPGSDEVPPYYRCQAEWYMDVIGCDTTDFIVTNFGRAPVVYTVKRDPEAARVLRARAAAFWRSLRYDTPPDLDAHGQTYATVRRLHPDIDPVEVEVDEVLAWDFRDAANGYRHHLDDWNLERARMARAMGSAKWATSGGKRIAMRRTPREGGTPYVISLEKK